MACIIISHIIVTSTVVYQVEPILDESEFDRTGYIVIKKHNFCYQNIPRFRS